MDLHILSEKLHPLERKVLRVLKDKTNIEEIESKTELKEVEIIRALQWLENKKIVETKKSESEIVSNIAVFKVGSSDTDKIFKASNLTCNI